ncbi:hypothetical protein, partial [Nocardioides stalactiti]|uniref:hypothetical protein n=1 Tax=Nocardioides stalactiti TaxID=2755356 RepID=UPI0015FEEFFB
AAAGLDVPAGDLSAADVRNERLGAETVEVLRVLNLHRLEQGAEPWQISNRAHVRALRGEDQGDQLTLPEGDLDRFLEQWAAPNAWVAREHLGDPGGTLFHEPRRSTGTTSEQVLDPARLDHYLDLLEVAAAGRAGIRAVAEREAARQARQG